MDNEELGIIEAGETNYPVIGLITSQEEANLILKVCRVYEYMNHIRSLAKTA